VYIYRSPYGEFYDFLSKLEVVINGVEIKNKDEYFAVTGTEIFFNMVKNYYICKTYF